MRITILLIGAVILALIYFIGQKKQRQRESLNDAFIEPQFIAQAVPPTKNDELINRPNALPRKKNSLSVDEAHAAHQAEQKLFNKDKIVTLFLHAKQGQQFDWHLIQAAAEQAGLEFGKDNLFYRFNGFGDRKELIFMVANMLKPGIFQPDVRTTGIVLIMTLPGVMPALDMWDSMFPVGERIAEILGGKLTDENHNLFTRQRIAAMRDEMRDFDHKHTLTI